MNKLSLFSGIGGDDIASEACGIKTVCMCEIDKDCRKVLRKHFPGIPIIKDVRDVNYETITAITNGIGYLHRQTAIKSTEVRHDALCNIGAGGAGRKEDEEAITDTNIGQGRPGNVTEPIGTAYFEPKPNDTNRARLGIDIISGGFPCQPHSVAGKHLGAADERDLWGEFRRIIGEIKPRWVVAENVPGLFSTDAGRFFRGILRDLSEMGYSTGWCTFGAVDVGAWHRRDRVFIVAHALNSRNRTPGIGDICTERDATDATESGLERSITEGGKCTNGLPAQCDYVPDPEEKRCKRGGDTRTRGNGFTNILDPTSEGLAGYGECEGTRQRERQMFANASTTGRRNKNGATQSGLGGVVDGFSQWMAEPDGVPRVARNIKARVAKLKALGNAVVPAQVYQVYKAIIDSKV